MSIVGKKLLRFYFFSFSFFLFSFSFSPFSLFAQSSNAIIQSVTQRFNAVNDYRADVQVVVDIPFIRMNPIHAKVVYRKPDQIKVKSTGILILPKQDANLIFKTLADTNGYTAIQTGEEPIGTVKTKIINVIPNADTSDLVLGKFWIDAARGLILKSQLTTKSNGTILVENTFGAMASFGLPDKTLFTVEVGKFKLPKAMSLDINRKSPESHQGDGKGRITLNFSNYIVNKGVKPEELE